MEIILQWNASHTEIKIFQIDVFFFLIEIGQKPF